MFLQALISNLFAGWKFYFPMMMIINMHNTLAKCSVETFLRQNEWRQWNEESEKNDTDSTNDLFKIYCATFVTVPFPWADYDKYIMRVYKIIYFPKILLFQFLVTKSITHSMIWYTFQIRRMVFSNFFGAHRVRFVWFLSQAVNRQLKFLCTK